MEVLRFEFHKCSQGSPLITSLNLLLQKLTQLLEKEERQQG
jgi:hypothetical protein